MNIFYKVLIKKNKIRDDLYYHLYYKHTKRHKKELKAVYDRVMARRMEIIGK